LTSLSISIVVYRPELRVLERTLSSLSAALEEAKANGCLDAFAVTIVDNSDSGDSSFASSLPSLMDRQRNLSALSSVISGHGNIGFGRGHNLTLSEAASDFHLILNPDVVLAPNVVTTALSFAEQHPEIGLIVPLVSNANGEQEFLCKRYPAVLDLLLRGFALDSIRRLFTRRLAHYEMRDVIGEREPYFDPPIVSGCFMLFRTPVLKQLGGFDPRYFLYFEDFDLSIRAARMTRIAYVPSVRITHLGGQAARKGLKHVRMFITSAYKFYSRHGWRWI
jgi:GT2 family glycosyltransferase